VFCPLSLSRRLNCLLHRRFRPLSQQQGEYVVPTFRSADKTTKHHRALRRGVVAV
jgi:hypothetical protein